MRYLALTILLFQSLISFSQREVIVKIDKEKMKKSNIYIQVDTMPDLVCNYEGDYLTKIKTFIGHNLKCPNPEIDCTGNVYVNFIVEPDSTISNVKILRGLDSCDGYNEEALRVTKLMDKWKPGKKNGQAVRVQLTVPVKFQLK